MGVRGVTFGTQNPTFLFHHHLPRQG